MKTNVKYPTPLSESIDSIFSAEITREKRTFLRRALFNELHTIFGSNDFRKIDRIDPYTEAKMSVHPALLGDKLSDELFSSYVECPTLLFSVPLKSPKRGYPRVRLNFEFSLFTNGVTGRFLSFQYLPEGSWEELLAYSEPAAIRELIGKYTTNMLQ